VRVQSVCMKQWSSQADCAHRAYILDEALCEVAKEWQRGAKDTPPKSLAWHRAAEEDSENASQ